MRIGRKRIHQQTVEKVGRNNALLNDPAPDSRVNQFLKQDRERSLHGRIPALRRIQPQNLQQAV